MSNRKSRILTGRGVAPLALALMAAAVPAACQAQGGAHDVAPGSHMVDGASIEHFVARWQERRFMSGEWSDGSVVSEEVTVDAGSNHVIFERHVDAGAFGLNVRVVMDRTTLRPVTLTREIGDDVPEAVATQLAAAGLMKSFEYRYTDAGYTARLTNFEGETTEESVELDGPVFDATPAGLILAALPLEVGFEARLPVLFVNGGPGTATLYDLVARAVAVESVEAPGGGTVEAFLVEVDWIDPATGAVTSLGGADEAGGAYWVTPSPPRDFPYVPRYKNNGIDYVLLGPEGR